MTWRLALFAVALAALPVAVEGKTICRTQLGWCTLPEDAGPGPDCECRNAGDDVPGFVVDVPSTNPLAELDTPTASRGGLGLPNATFASRAFAGPSQLPPQGFRAYGVMIFKSRASRFDRDRHMYMCEAYANALARTSELSVPTEQQMVTIWPVMRDDIADEINALPAIPACEKAVDNYGLVHARNALEILERFSGPDGPYDTSGRGPFLVAWTPGDDITGPDAVALMIDLSHVEGPEQAGEMLTLWHDKVQSDPALWEENSLQPRLLDVIRRFFDEQGEILESVSSL